MTSEMVSGDLVNLAERIRTEHQACLQSVRKGVEHALKVGELLVQAKELVKHGDWTNWLEVNCDFTPRMARYYMNAFRHVQDKELKTETISEMTLTDVLAQSGAYVRVERARKKSVEKGERQKRWKLELEDKQVKNYLDAVKGFRQEIRDAVDAAEFGKFSPEAIRFTVRRNDEIRQELDRLEYKTRKLGSGSVWRDTQERTSGKTWRKEKVEATEEIITVLNRLETLVSEVVQSEKTALGEHTLAMVKAKVEKIDKTLGKYLEGGEQ